MTLSTAARCDLKECFRALASTHQIKSVLVEGGANIIQSILENELASQVSAHRIWNHISEN